MVNIYKLYKLEDGGKKHSTWKYYLSRKDTDFTKHCCRVTDKLVEKVKVSKAGKRYASAVKNSEVRRIEPCCSQKRRYKYAMEVLVNPSYTEIPKILTSEEVAELAAEGNENAQEIAIVTSEVSNRLVKKWRDELQTEWDAIAMKRALRDLVGAAELRRLCACVTKKK